MTVQESLREVLMAHPVVAKLSLVRRGNGYKLCWCLLVVFDELHIRMSLLNYDTGHSYNGCNSICNMLRDNVPEFIYWAVAQQLEMMVVGIECRASSKYRRPGIADWTKLMRDGSAECRGLRACSPSIKR